MKRFLLFIFMCASVAVFPQGKSDRLNSTIFYVLVADVTFNKPNYHLLINPAKIKSAKIKKMEVIQSLDYISDPSLPDIKGIESIDRREIVEYDKNGNPIKFSNYSYSWDGFLLDYTISYGQDGLISGVSMTSQDTTKKMINYSGKYMFAVNAGKLSTITYEDDPQFKGMGLPNSYNFVYRSDGSLEKITAGVDAHDFITCDEKGKVATLLLGSKKIRYHYDKNGVITKESVEDEYGDKWEMTYKYDSKENLLSVKSNKDAFIFEEMTYSLAKDGFPSKAKLLYDTKSSRRGVNFEFKYSK
ncbi:MAG: hypothetical protein IT278_01795 [Ignavibacteriaceae bacterium]|nr:hypothetical protein [Ignavibacteriaceae bacterium]